MREGGELGFAFSNNIQIMLNHKSMQVRCAVDEPIQLLMDKLSSKSSDLYIFWQNYNQLYHAYHEKTAEIARLTQEIDHLRREKLTQKPIVVPEESFFKERYLLIERGMEETKAELERTRQENRELKRENQKHHEDNLQLQTLLQQLRDENSGQRSSIEKVLSQLRAAQGEINSMTRVYEELAQKEMVLARYVGKEKELLEHIADLEAEIDDMAEQSRETKALYEKLIKESMVNAKNKVMESLPGLIQTSKTKVQVVSS